MNSKDQRQEDKLDQRQEEQGRKTPQTNSNSLLSKVHACMIYGEESETYSS